jgi:hypothetical protein
VVRAPSVPLLTSVPSLTDGTIPVYGVQGLPELVGRIQTLETICWRYRLVRQRMEAARLPFSRRIAQALTSKILQNQMKLQSDVQANISSQIRIQTALLQQTPRWDPTFVIVVSDTRREVTCCCHNTASAG